MDNQRKKLSILILFLLIPFIFPDSLIRITSINNIIKIWKLLAGGTAIVFCIAKERISLPLVALSLFYLEFTFSALLHFSFNIDWLMLLAFLWVIEFCTANLKRLESFLDVYIKIGCFLIYINLITIFLYPNGMYVTSAYELNWFLGYKNGIIRKTLPILIAILINSQLKNRKLYKKEIIGFICGILGILLSQSHTGWVGIAIFLVLMFIIRINKFPANINLVNIFAVYILFDILVLNMGDIVSKFKYFFTAILGKYGSMSGRVVIWDRTKQLIISSPLTGYGTINSDFYHFSFTASHPHNLLLYYLMAGGILGILIFLFALYQVDRGIKFYKNKHTKVINQFFLASYIVYFLMGLFESLIGATFFVPFMLLMYNINREVLYNNRNMHTI